MRSGRGEDISVVSYNSSLLWSPPMDPVSFSPVAALPLDLLLHILCALQPVDIIRSGAVCRSWRSAVSLLQSRQHGYRPRPESPWLMLSDPNNPQSRYFYSFSEHKAFHFHLPHIAGHHLVGSSNGFLISTDKEEANLHALNPVTGTRIPLPPAAALPEVTGVVRDSLGHITEYLVVGEYPNENNNANQPNNNNTGSIELMFEHYYQRAIVSTLSYAVVVICNDHRLVFARPGDTSWTAIDSRFFYFDMIFRKGKLYAVDFAGTLLAFDLDLDQPLEPPTILVDHREQELDQGVGSAPLMHYLMESPDGDDLFLVSRNSDGDLARTVNFKVFKLDESKHKWNEYDDDDEEFLSFFLGINQSILLSSQDFPTLTSNLIHYTDDYYTSMYYSHLDMHISGDQGVFDSVNRSITPLNLSVDLQHLDWPPPMWLSPTLF